MSDSWRGVAAEDQDQLSDRVSVLLRARSRRLLADLLRPHRGRIMLLTAVIVLSGTAGLALPYLVKAGIDDGIPPMLAGQGPGTLLIIIALIVVATLVQALTRQVFLQMSGRIGRTSSWRCAAGSSIISSGSPCRSTRGTPPGG